jgi:hypothetical protein
LSAKKASHLLQAAFEVKRQQYYLVRFSEGEVGGFYLTFIEEEGKIANEKITNGKGLFRVKFLSHATGKWYVESLMQEFDTWKKLISACKTAWNLKKVLSGSPYDNILKKNFI